MPRLIPIKDKAALVLEDGSIYKIQHKRQRKVLSCVRCHQKKTKCDKTRPTCNNCVKHEVECVYFVNDRIFEPQTYSPKVPSESNKGTVSTHNEESVIENNLSTGSFPRTEKIVSGSDESLSNSQIQNENVQTRATSLSDLPDNVDSALSMSAQIEGFSSMKNKKEILAAMEEAKKYATMEQSIIAESKRNKRKYTKKDGTSNGGISKKHIKSKSKISSVSGEGAANYSPHNLTHTAKINTAHNLPTYIEIGTLSECKRIINIIPTELESQNLFKRFCTSVHPVLPILKIKNYSKRLRVFYKNLNCHTFINYKFLIQMGLINYTSLRSIYFDMSIQNKNNSKLEKLMDIHKRFINGLLVENNNIPVLVKFTAEVMICSIVENPKFTKIAELIRLAEKLQLNRPLLKTPGYSNNFQNGISSTPFLAFSDKDKDSNTLKNSADLSDSFDSGDTEDTYNEEDDDDDDDDYENGEITSETIQFRRKLFWQLYELDTLTSLHNDLPPLIRDLRIPLPNEVDASGNLNPSVCFLNAKYRFIMLLNELCVNLKTGSIDALKEKIVGLHSCCTGSWLSLKNYRDMLLDTHCERDQMECQDELHFIDWAMYNIKTYPDRALLLLHLHLIKISMPVLVKRKRKLIEFGQHFLTIQNILNDSGNLQLDGSNIYNYEDLTNNLIPSSLHYLDEFNKITDIYMNEGWSSFNWELSNVPINAITFTLKTLALDLNRNANNKECYNLNNDLRYILLKKCIPKVEKVIEHVGGNKQQCVCTMCFQLVGLLFELIKIKYGLVKHYHEDNENCKFYFNKYDIEQQSIFNEGIFGKNILIPQPAPAPSINTDVDKLNSSQTTLTSPSSASLSSPSGGLLSETLKTFGDRNYGSSQTVPTISVLQQPKGKLIHTSSQSINDILNISGTRPSTATSPSASASATASSSSISMLSTSTSLSSLIFNKSGSEDINPSSLKSTHNSYHTDEYYNIMSYTTKKRKMEKMKIQVERYILILNDGSYPGITLKGSKGDGSQDSSSPSSSSSSSMFENLSQTMANSLENNTNMSDPTNNMPASIPYGSISPDYYEHDDYFREFENATLEILSGLLSVPI